MTGKKIIITGWFESRLYLYAPKEWATLIEKWKLPFRTEREARMAQRVIFAQSMEAELDKWGRILITDYLKRHAKIRSEKKVVIIYRKRYGCWEIWNEENYQLETKRARESIAR